MEQADGADEDGTGAVVMDGGGDMGVRTAGGRSGGSAPLTLACSSIAIPNGISSP